MDGKVAVIICAAGKSSRFGGKKKKPFEDVNGKAAFLYSLELFSELDCVKQILVAIAADQRELVEVKWGANLEFFGAKTYIGGDERFETVQKGLAIVKEDIDLVAVHDAARCCVTKEWVEKVLEKAAKTKAALLACPVTATIKRVQKGSIVETVDRNELYEAQTPQVFDAALLKKAYANIDKLDKSKISDDAQLVEAMGEEISIVETDFSNIKITTKSDIPIAEAILKNRPKPKQEGYVGPYGEAKW